MNNYRKKNYRGKRSYSGRSHRRTADSYHQPLQPDQTRIPYARHTLTKPDVEAVVDALLSGTLTQGRELDRFESLLAKLTHSEFAIAFSSGTAAVHAALACLKLEPEDEIITSTLNFCSVTNMIKLVGATPVLADCDPETLTLSVEAAEKAITPNTKAIFTNNFGGHPSDLKAMRALCDEHNLLLLEDASHGLGGKYRGHYIGNQADITCFSFHPSKAITTCEGGAVTTNNRSIASWLRLFRHHGIQKDPRFFQSDESYPSYYLELQFQGMNYRLSEVHAALGRSQLTRLDRHIERRRSIAQVYFQKLGTIPELILPHVAEWADNAFHLYPIQLQGALADKRDEVFNDLKNAGLDVQVHYVPVHRMPVYRHVFGEPQDFPNAEAYFGRAITLPLYPDLSYKDLERITDLVIKFTTKYLTEVRTTAGDAPEEGQVADAETEAHEDADAGHPHDIGLEEGGESVDALEPPEEIGFEERRDALVAENVSEPAAPSEGDGPANEPVNEQPLPDIGDEISDVMTPPEPVAEPAPEAEPEKPARPRRRSPRSGSGRSRRPARDKEKESESGDGEAKSEETREEKPKRTRAPRTRKPKAEAADGEGKTETGTSPPTQTQEGRTR